jgi:hypothetical protein
MKVLLLFLIITFNLYQKDIKTVFICNSDGAKKYHLKSNCRGLSNCQHKVIPVTLGKAKGQGKTLCKWED